jgi:hypothetical protein
MKEKNKSIIYPSDIYQLTYDIHKILRKSKLELSGSLTDRIVSGDFLFNSGDSISEETYYQLWRNILLICDKPFYLERFWDHSCLYYAYMRNVRAANDKIEYDMNRFVEFHYAFGALVLYNKQYELLNYMFITSQYGPLHGSLLPETMTEIFERFMVFQNYFDAENRPFHIVYPFPDLDNLGVSWQIKNWICKYIVLLFIRQFTLQQYYAFQNPTSQPTLSDNINKLKLCQDHIPFYSRNI